MKLKHLALTAALACAAATPVMAADQMVDLSTGEGSFIGSAPVLAGGDDVISFVNLAAGTYNFLLTVSAQHISGLTASLNGQTTDVNIDSGQISFRGLESNGQSPFVLTLTGTTGAGALYSGELTVTAVPEPSTYALMLAGLGVVGFMARRRKDQA